ITQGEAFLKRALVTQRMGRYACEAAIAQIHATAQRPEKTDWARIVHLYDALLEINSSPIVELNRAAAIAMRDGPAAGLAFMDDIIRRGVLSDYRFAHAARADMCRRLGRNDEARSAYAQALELTQQEAERRYIAGRMAELE
ncbi:MAG: RNA polymerase subunit sigma-24, partial [Rhodanobacteraceae bacterium]